MSGFHVENFGCRAARADGEAISHRLLSAGHSAQQPSSADVIVVNTCSVTAEADRAARAFIRRAHRLNPQARIVVTGCYAQRAPQELAALPGVSAVVGNSHKAFAPQIALDLAHSRDSLKGTGSSPYNDHLHTSQALGPEANLDETGRKLVSIQSLSSGANSTLTLKDDRFAHSFLEEAQVVPGTQTRPNLKIQEGCGNRCTFCVIPQTRGNSRSLPADAVLKQVAGFVSAGGNELVFSGINLGRWGRDLPGPQKLSSLVRRIFDQTPLPRLRLSSIEPMDWDTEMIALMAEFGGSRLARHAHLPLQSGSDAVLRRMHRRYRPWHYEEKVHALFQTAGPDLTLGADVMVGFPAETGAEFEETLELVRKLPFAYLHIFPFSPRPGTRAWALHQQHPVPQPAVDERIAALRALALEKSKSHRRSFVGRELEAITLHTPPELAQTGRTTALTENFLPVEIEGKLPANQLVSVRISTLHPDGALKAQPAKAASSQYAATAMSVKEKSVPLNSNSSPVSFASA